MYTNVKRKIWIVLVFAAVLLLPLGNVKNVEAAKISKKSFTMTVGQKRKYSVKTKSKKWRVSVGNKSVVKCKVNKKKKVLTITALKPGKTTVTVKGVRWKKIKQYKLTVTVKAKEGTNNPNSGGKDKETPEDKKPDSNKPDNSNPGNENQGENPGEGNSGENQGENPGEGNSGENQGENPGEGNSGENQGENPGEGNSGENQGENQGEITNTDAKATTLTFETADGGDFVQGCSTQEVTFALNNDVKEVQVQILDAADNVVYVKTFTNCTQNTEYSFEWDGKKGDGTLADPATYKIRVVAGAEQTDSDYFSLYPSDTFDGGTGSETNPYQVRTLEQFQKIALYGNRCFVQTADIDGELETFYTMGADDNPFMGTYDGNGKSISNLLIQSKGEDGRSAVMIAIGEKGIIKNLTFRNCSAGTTGEYASILAYKIDGRVQKCKFEKCTVSVTKDQCYAGVVGIELSSTGMINECEVTDCTLSSTAWSANSTGGVVGRNIGKIVGCQITNIELFGKCTGVYENNDDCGGIAGVNNNGGIIINCNVTGCIDANKGAAGGIAGTNKGQILSCTFSGTTTGNFKGDFAGVNNGIITN